MKQGLWLPWKKGVRLVELLIFPSFCRVCSGLLAGLDERIICRPCWKKIPLPPAGYCLSCGRFLSGDDQPSYCFGCQQERKVFSVHRSCTRYEGMAKEIIWLFKYGKIKVLGKKLASLAIDRLEGDGIFSGVEVIVPVPLHPKKERTRGFNQAAEIARSLGQRLKIRVAPRALIKVRDNLAQASLEAESRRENVRGVYDIRERGKIEGKVVLLVDDVYTTGSTIAECSRILRKAGAKEIRALTIAQA